LFEAGALGFRLQMIGAEVFKKDAKGADDAVKALGDTSEKAAKKVAPTGAALEKTGAAAKAAKAPVEDAGKATKKLGDEAGTAAPKLGKTAAEVAALKKESADAARTIGVAAVGVGAAMLTMAGFVVGTYAKFDQASSKTAAATQANIEQQKLLKASAIEQGAASIYSAKEAADAQTELAKAGVSVNDILGGGLKGSLALAAAGELAVARAAEIAATTLTVFGLKGDQAGHVADLLAAGAGKAQGSVEDLSLGLGYVGVSFARLNVPLEDTVGTLALLAANGLLGEKAGTGLRSVMSSLTAPVAKGAAEMKKYNINVFDAQGKFVGMAAAAQQLQDGLGGLNEETRSAALGAIFGAEAASAAGILYKAGAKGVKEWTDNVNDQGFAMRQAAAKADNLMGDIELLGGSMDSILIKTGGQANGTLRDMVQILIGLTDWYGSLDEGVQGTVLTFGVATGAALLLGGTFLLAVPKIVAFRAALTELNTKMRGTALAGGLIGVALTAAVVVLGVFGAAQGEAAAKAKAYGDTLKEVTNEVTDATRAMAKEALSAKGNFLGLDVGADSAYDAAAKIGLSLDTVTDAATGNSKALAVVRDKLAEIQGMSGTEKEAAFGKNWALAEGSAMRVAEAVQGESNSVDEAIRVAKQKESVDGDTADSNAVVESSYTAVTDAVDGVVSSVSDLADELDALNGQHLDARDAARNLEASYRDFDAALKDNGVSLNQAGTDLDITTEKGAALQQALDDMASAAGDAGQAVIDSGGSYDEYKASLQGSKEQIDNRIAQLGITGDAAEQLSDKILHIPTEREFTMYAETDAATQRIKGVLDLLDSVPTSKQTSIGITAPNALDPYRINEANGSVLSFANGGEHHVAQIAKAGTMRVWAEPETGGEAYIPLAGAKRGRSTAILADVANQFGYQLVSAGAQSFASGSNPAPVSAPAKAAETTRPIYMDGSLFGYLKEIANGEARIVLNDQSRRNR